jgi:DNA-binding CsgD family transcriptional regulator
MPPARILERDRELAELERLLGLATGGEGQVVLLNGPAGIGKTELLRHARRLAEQAGAACLSAVASALDRSFAFGLVHQLLDPVLAAADPARRERLLSGAAARADVVLRADADSELVQDPGFAVLHGLYWLLVNLAEEGPLALFVDDLHWADGPSLRLLEYVGRRVEGVSLLVVGAVRTGEPGADEELLAALAAGPAAHALWPGALSDEAAGALVAEGLGHQPEAAFASACAAATGGNPLLLRALVREATDRGLRGTAAEAGRATALGSAGIAPAVQRRLRLLGPDATALAGAAAVLGATPRLDDLAAVAGLALEDGRRAADRLVAAELLEAESWSFVHPLVREAVAERLPASERTRLHALAARRLRERGARVDEVAVHLMACDPAGDPTVVETLREAARTAAAEGAPETAVAHLERALAEPPAPEDRARVLLDLGELEQRVNRPGALARLDAALAAGLAGDERARARALRGAQLLLADPIPALAEFESALAEAADPDLRLRLEALVLEATIFHASFTPRRSELLEAGRRAADPSPVMLAVLAQEAAYRGDPRAEVVALAGRATSGGFMDRVGPGTNTYNLLVHGLRYAEEPELAARLLDEGEAIIRRLGERFAAFFIDHARAYWHYNFGSVATGSAHAATGLAHVRGLHADVTVAAFAAIAAELLVEQDRLDEAAAIVDALDAPAIAETVSGAFALSARALVRMQQERHADAEADARRALELLDERGWRAPMVSRAPLRLARQLGHRGEEAAALELLDDAEAVARRAGTTGAVGSILRVRGRVVGGRQGLELLSEAVDALAASPLGLEHAWALHDLGGALRRAGRRADAREPLRQALEIADRKEALLLARRARDELAATGARPRRTALSGPASLTPSERRVAELAAAGLSNREIAENLWVTRKTVELHLGHAYGKLGIRARTQLAAALEGGAAAAA